MIPNKKRTCHVEYYIQVRFLIKLTEGDYTGFVENKKQHIKRVNGEKAIALPFFEFALKDRGHDSNGASGNANGEVEHKVNSVNGESLAVYYGAERKNKRCVDYVSSDDITNRKGIFLFADRSKGCNKLGEGGAESDNGEADDRLADSYS